MEDTSVPTVVVHVDPSCPFAWITSRWLAEVERQQPIDLHIRLLSLSVVNEHRQLDDWYRGFNDAAWAPARVMAAVVDAHGELAGRRFYEAFGTRFHVALGTADEVDRVAVAAAALAAADLPADLVDAAADDGWDDNLRAITRRALEPVGLDVGVPVVTVDGIAASGPVLSEIPRGDAAVALLDAVRTLAVQRGFVRFERRRDGELQTA
jgi:hypothetical protein